MQTHANLYYIIYMCLISVAICPEQNSKLTAILYPEKTRSYLMSKKVGHGVVFC